MRTQVVIIGGGPAGLLLSQLLQLNGVDNLILERKSREYVMARIRAGVIEEGSAQLLRSAEVGDRMDAEGFVHHGVNISTAGRMFHVDFRDLVGQSVIIYGQTEITKDLYEARDRMGGLIVDEADNVQPHGLESERPYVTYEKDGSEHRVDCDFVAGCDGFHGVSRRCIPGDLLQTFERDYPFGWLGVLSETPPVNDELIYCGHDRGFALCSMRNEMLSRYYLQVPVETELSDWPDGRFWEELQRRIPPEAAERLVTGPSVEKSIAPIRSFVAEPMQFGRLFLAGDAAHIMPPTGAKGLNLAFSDVHYLSSAVIEHYKNGTWEFLDAYTETALRRVWKAIRFSWWMTSMLHVFPENGSFGLRIQHAELDYLSVSAAAQTAMAENYVGLPL